MISVLPLSHRQAMEYYVENGLPVSEKAFGVQAVCKAEILGICLFDLNKKGILIRTLSPQSDAALADGILRAALHVAAERSAMDARYAATAPEALFMQLGFVLNPAERTLDIDKLFRPCGCCEK